MARGCPSRRRTERLIWLSLLSAWLLTACQAAPLLAPSAPTASFPTLTPFQPLPPGALFPAWFSSESLPLPTPTASPVLTPQAGPTASPPPTPTTSTIALWADPRLPPPLLQALHLPPGFSLAATPDQAQLRLSAGAGAVVSRWVYALAAPFPTLTDGVSSETLQHAWAGLPDGPFGGSPLLMDESTVASLSALWGDPAPNAVAVLPAEQLLSVAWERRSAWAILPFEALEPRWKVLTVDGQSPLHKNFNLESYPLTVPISLQGEEPLVETVRSVYGSSLLPAFNRDPDRLTVVILTGVTALVRGTAYAMERKGLLYPAQDIAAVLQAADFTHLSNEVPFAEDCPFPNPLQQGMRFCSDPRYIALMEAVGTDIVELTGDHFQDWGNQAMLLTLQMYAERGWWYYGGGANLTEGRQPLLLEHNGNRLAFIGCNAKGGSFAQASSDQPGAASCDLPWMAQEISRLRQAGYLPIATFQHGEFYTYEADITQKRDFRQLAEAGAVIVSGSQAHQPQALEFRGSPLSDLPALIHYGLGNLFFDQYDVSLATRQGFIDRHVFYEGRYLGVELLSIMFVDYARPRWMTPEERLELLQAVFSASGW